MLEAVTQLPRQPAAANGSPCISQSELKKALSATKPGKAPGLDGLPTMFYKLCSDQLLPVMCRVFSAIGSLGVTPPGFLDGVIVGIFKEGDNDPALAASYRPITLLNIDYRLLAKTLANRLQLVLGRAISPTQTAFVQGRRIGHNIITAQLLLHASPDDSHLVAALLDFSKAYDTIHRPFLLSVMSAMGVPEDFCKWVKTLLQDTQACASFNGYLSGMHQFFAGVRQGCPLAPLLYNFVAEALLRFLKHKGICVVIHGVSLTASQYADDTQVYLPSHNSVPAFVSVMDVFGQASGQKMNLDKSLLLLLGKQARDQHAHLVQQHAAGALPLKPVLQARVLGVTVGSEVDGFLPPDEAEQQQQQRYAFWQHHVDNVKAALKRISHLSSLTAFGRAFGSSAYGISKLLFDAEFSDLPPADLIEALDKAVAKLVDRGLAPDSHERAFTGVKQLLLLGSPAQGGFGALAWREHLLARHAWWGALFVSAPPDTDVPWIRLGRAFLRRKCRWWGPLACLDASTTHQSPVGDHFFARPPQPLRRMLQGLQALGPLCDVRCLQQPTSNPPAQPLQPLCPGDCCDEHITLLKQHMCRLAASPCLTPGPWCALAPLYANHFLPCTCIPGIVPNGLQSVPVPAARSAFHLSGGYVKDHIRTLADLCRSYWIIQHAVDNDQPHPLCPGDCSDACGELDYIKALFANIPVAWLQAALAAVQDSQFQPAWPPPCLPDASVLPCDAEQWVEHMLVSRLGWQGLHGGKAVSIARLTVKSATALQTANVTSERLAKHQQFVARALHSSDSQHLGVGVKQLHVCMHKLWKRVKWDNALKEVFWRLTVDGLPTAGRMHMQHSACLCGSPSPDVQHHFWDCTIAKAVVSTLLSQLPPAWCTRPPAGDPSISQHHIWLMQPPPGPNALHRVTWLVLCLAAINAMDYGRKAANQVQTTSAYRAVCYSICDCCLGDACVSHSACAPARSANHS